MKTLEKVIRFALACAPGIVLGMWLAPKLGLWWPVAAIVGATVSYTLVEWKAVIRAIPVVLHQASPWFHNWLMDRQMWKARRDVFIALACVTTSILLILYALKWYFLGVVGGMPPTIAYRAYQDFGVCANMIVFFCYMGELFSLVWAAILLCMSREQLLDMDSTKPVRWCIKFANPFAVFLYWPVRGLLSVPKVVCFFGRFLRIMFFAIHSQKRTLVATTALITIVVGYTVQGDLITFTVAGSVIGGLYSVSPFKVWVEVKLRPQPNPV
jgi:hypothetical protein